MRHFDSAADLRHTTDHGTFGLWSAYGAAAAVAMLGAASFVHKTSGKAMSSTSQRQGATLVPRAAFDPTAQVGVTAPFGFWDPAGLLKDRSGAWEDERQTWSMEEATFRQYRMAELKHGRLAMLAALGMFTESFVKFPGVFRDVPSECSGLKVLSTEAGGAGLGIVLLLASFFEITSLKQDPSKEPGDLGDPLQIGAYEGFGYTIDMRNKEINHGRLAMSGVATEFLIELSTGKTPAEQLQGSTATGAVIAVLMGLMFVWTGSGHETPASIAAPTVVKTLPSSALSEVEEQLKQDQAKK